MNKEQTRSELQERIAADLRAKATARSLADGTSNDDFDKNYLAGTKKTTTLAGPWLLLIVIGGAVLVLFVVKSIAR